MYFSLVLLAFLVGQALAFGLTTGNRVMDVSDILNIPESPVKVFCNANCTDSSAKIAACGNDPACLCSLKTVVSLRSCETCMLHFLIARDTPAPDFRAGSNAIMGAYGAACMTHAKVLLPTNLTSLSLPKSWNGPFVAVLHPAVAVFYATFGAILGLSALYILSNLA